MDNLFATVRESDPDAVLITGDIADARTVVGWLERMDDAWDRPIYFVLGNHDFYGGSIAGVRASVTALSRKRPNLRYLTAGDVFELTPHVGLVGDDGWADARLGNYEHSLVMMNDYRLIAELAPVVEGSALAEVKAIRRPGGGACSQNSCRRRWSGFRSVLLATHVPPLRDACWHEGQLSDNEWLPHFTCKAVGDVILETMRRWPQRQLTVYCGHTHSSGICQPLPNVTIHTGAAKYGFPRVQEVIDIGE